MSQGKILISINNEEVLYKIKKLKGFSSKTIEILLEMFFEKAEMDQIWAKYFEGGVNAYRDYVRELFNGHGVKESEITKKIDIQNTQHKKEEQVFQKQRKKSVKIDSSTFWQ